MSEENTTVEKTPCEICGDLVTVHAAGRAAHMRSHRNQTASASGDETGSVSDTETTSSGDLSGVSPTLRAEIEAATKIADRRKKDAPNASVGIDGTPTDVLTATVNRLRKKGVLKASDHPFWGVDEKRKHYLSEGYVPVLEDGRQVIVREMELFKLPRVVHEANERVSAKESEDRLQSHIAAASAPDLEVGTIKDGSRRQPRTADNRSMAD